MSEYSFMMLKPDAVQRDLVDETLSYLEEDGLQICAMTRMTADRDLIDQHYDNKQDDPGVMQELHRYFGTASGGEGHDIVPIVTYGADAAQRTRDLVGGDSWLPEENEPGTIRGDVVKNPDSAVYADPLEEPAMWPHYRENAAKSADIPVYNMVHAAENEQEAMDEIRHFFGDELLTYLEQGPGRPEERRIT